MRVRKESKGHKKVRYEADDRQLIEKIETLSPDERNAIAVCSYHPIDQNSFNPDFQDTMYRRSDTKHPFFEINYAMEFYQTPKLTIPTYQQVYLSGKIEDTLLAQLMDLDKPYKSAKPPNKNFILCFVDKENQKHFLHIDEKGKKTSLDSISASLAFLVENEGPLVKPGKGKFEQLRSIPSETILDLDPNCPLKTELVIVKMKKPDTNNIAKVLAGHTNSALLILDEEEHFKYFRYRGITKAQNQDFDFNSTTNTNTILQQALETLETDEVSQKVANVISKEAAFILSKDLTPLIVTPINENPDTNVPEPGTKKIRIYHNKDNLMYLFKGIDGTLYKGNIGQKELFLKEDGIHYDEALIKKAVGQHALQKQVASENATFEQLKEYFDEKSTRSQPGTGLNPQVIGGKKEKSEAQGDLHPLVNQADSEPLKHLEDAILTHKTTEVKYIVDLLSADLSSADNAVRINALQKSANYPCVIVNFNLESWSTFTKTVLSNQPLKNVERADVGTYNVYKSNSHYEIEYVGYEEGKTVKKKLTIKPEQEEQFQIYMAQVENKTIDPVKFQNTSLKTFVADPCEVPNRNDYPALTQLLMAFINYELYDNKLGNYFDRRDSFGFLTPTGTDVGSATRLSLGLVPNKEWIHCLITGTKKFNEFLTRYAASNKLLLGDINANFSNTHLKAYGHKVFLEKLIASKGNFFTLGNFFTKISSKKEAIAICKKYDEPDAFQTLSEQLRKEATHEKASTEFLELYKAVDDIYDRMLESLNLNANAAPPLDETIHQKMLALRNKIDDFRWRSYLAVQQEEDKTLDVSSESEEGEEEHGYKYYTPSGMSALALPLIIYGLQTGEKPVRFHLLPYAYFELTEFRTYFKEEHFQEIEKSTEASVLFYDNNPCVTGFAETPVQFSDELQKFLENPSSTPKLVIVDITSSTLEQQKEILRTWKSYGGNNILCLAQSALKNRQLSLDMAHYGIIKIFCNDEENPLYQSLQKELHQLSAQTASAYATIMRRELREAAKDINAKAHQELPPGTLNAAMNKHSFFRKEKTESTRKPATTEGLNKFPK